MSRFNLRSILKSAALAIGLAVAPAYAQQPAGLPMWVIKDADSTIYVTGTVHMLPPDLKWTNDKLTKAIKDAKELWLELPMGSDPNKYAQSIMPIMMKYAISPTPLNKLLTKDEQAKLQAAITRGGLPPETSMMLNLMKPWYATLLVGISPLMGAGFDPAEGIDVKIAKLAEDDNDPIKGFESFEEQLKILASGTDAEQLEALRATLAMDPAELLKSETDSKAAFEAWAKGDPEPTRALFANVAQEGLDGTGAASIDALLKNRNENWAGQIETMLKGSGVSFIAVGAGHLVGPDSLFDRLKLRGISATRY